NQGAKYSKVKISDPVEIKVGDKQTSVYKGEIIGLEPTYKGGEKTRLVVKAMNKMHRLMRNVKSVTFTDKTDQQILNKTVSDVGLTLDSKPETCISYKPVSRHSRRALEFLRTRAARMGCYVWCVDTTINVKQPELTAAPIADLKINDSSTDG